MTSKATTPLSKQIRLARELVFVRGELLRLRAENTALIGKYGAELIARKAAEAERDRLRAGLQGMREWREAYHSNGLLDKADALDEALKGFE